MTTLKKAVNSVGARAVGNIPVWNGTDWVPTAPGAAGALGQPARGNLQVFTGIGAEPARTPLTSVTLVTGTACLLMAFASGLATVGGAGSPRLYIQIGGVDVPFLGCVGNSYGASEGVQIGWTCVATGLTPGANTFALTGSFAGPGQWTIDPPGQPNIQTAWLVAISLT